MTIAFKLNRTKKKVNHKFEITFNLKKEIHLKCFLSPLGDTLSPLGIVPFYIRNPFKIHLEQKKVHQNMELTFNLKKKLPFFFYPLGGIVLFYIGKSFKIHLEQTKKFTKKLNSPLILNKKSL